MRSSNDIERARALPSLIGIPPSEMESHLQASLSRFKRYHTDILCKWIYKKRCADFAEMSDLGKVMRRELEEHYELDFPAVENVQKSQDGTVKFLFRLDDGSGIESVYIPEKDRHTLCVSSQVGCARACSFCFTATRKLKRNLTAREIVGQLLAAEAYLKPISISNVVFMGMGEPFDNWGEVSRAIEIFYDDRCLAKSRRRIVISTAGHVPGILAVGRRSPFRLSVSLHAADDETRNRLMPINRQYPLAALIPALRQFAQLQQDRVTFEYILLKDVNVSLDRAKAFHKLIANVPAKINLIPFNPFPGAPFTPAPNDQVKEFAQYLFDKGHLVIIRKSRGADILGACGQLVGSTDPA